MNSITPSLITREWLEADGLGGFASGTAAGIRTRRYHALLLAAQTPPTGRFVLVNGLDAWVETARGRFALSSQWYAPGVLGGEGTQLIEAFEWQPWPHWIFKIGDGLRIEQELFAVKGQPLTCLSWRVLDHGRNVKLCVRPLLSGRDYHSLHKANPAFRFDAEVGPGRVSWSPYGGVPAVTVIANAAYSHQPEWYYNFRYEEEIRRGLDGEEDLASPGILSWNLTNSRATLIFTTRDHAEIALPVAAEPVGLFDRFRAAEENRRGRFASPLEAAGDSYIVRRQIREGGDLGENSAAPAAPAEHGKTIVAGYPWFTDWGRDTFIALRGLCLATGRLEEAREILLAWIAEVSAGMLPNRFPDHGEQPEFNAVDASLWFIIAASEYLQLAEKRPSFEADRTALARAIEAILEGYAKGSRYGIHLDDDGLLAAGERGVQLTWMDAKVGDWVVTPRAGKPVEVQALWLNALHIGRRFRSAWSTLFDRGLASFRRHFWNERGGCLHDVIDVNHRKGGIDETFRPNQILAVGGLPLSLLEPEQAARVVAAVEARLWVPLGLRSLAPGEQGYVARYEGGVVERDGSYHQGTVWPWLIGPFVEAWVRVRGGTSQAKREARGKFLPPLLAHLEEAGLGHLSEIVDAEEPHTPRGCPFQAWSIGEVLRLDRVVLAETRLPAESRTPSRRRRRELVPA